MAVLKEEKIVATLKGKHRSHEYQGSDEFLESMNKLIADGIDLKAEVTSDKKLSEPVKGNASAAKQSTRSNKP
jgi:type IV secretory pathway VirD2 relaxase